MNCRSCNTQLAAGSTVCFFCGAPQSLHASAVGGGQGASPAAWNWGAPNSVSLDAEFWRVWVSWVLFGTYAPLAGLYLLQREEWNVGLRPATAPPIAPSQRGLYVFALILFMPVVLVMFFGFLVEVSGVRWETTASYAAYGTDGSQQGWWSGLRGAYGMGVLNLTVVSYLASLVLTGDFLHRRFEALLIETSGGDPLRLLRYRKLRVLRIAAQLATLVPALLLLTVLTASVLTGWSHVLTILSWLMALSLFVSAWTGSWLNISPFLRYRRVVSPTP
jgi:hypothetical protein